MQSNISGPEMLFQQARDKPTSPFIEIAEHNPRPRQVGVAEYGFADQFARLALSLDERGAEMHIVNAQQAFSSQIDVDAQAAALFASRHAYVMVLRGEQREAA